MIKLIWISDTKIKGIIFWLLQKFSEIQKYDVKGEDAEEIVEHESTDFLYLAIKRPANTDDMNRLCLRNINRLRVSVFKFHPFKSRILNFFFPPDVIKTIAQNILHGSSSKGIRT